MRGVLLQASGPSLYVCTLRNQGTP
jgi:hypothetical protein